MVTFALIIDYDTGCYLALFTRRIQVVIVCLPLFPSFPACTFDCPLEHQTVSLLIVLSVLCSYPLVCVVRYYYMY